MQLEDSILDEKLKPKHISTPFVPPHVRKMVCFDDEEGILTNGDACGVVVRAVLGGFYVVTSGQLVEISSYWKTPLPHPPLHYGR